MPERHWGARLLSLTEFGLGAAIVIAHNVFHRVPNEVPILFVFCLLSVRLREGSFRAVGLARPKSWLRTITLATLTAAAVVLLGQYVSGPLAGWLHLHGNSTAVAHALVSKQGDVWSAAQGLALVWTFAAFGEEIGYRRYLLGRAADALGGGIAARWLALLASSVLFGFGHFYQGPAGVFTTAIDGFVIGAGYLLGGRNLWVAVLAHGFVDTFAIALLFFGLAN